MRQRREKRKQKNWDYLNTKIRRNRWDAEWNKLNRTVLFKGSAWAEPFNNETKVSKKSVNALLCASNKGTFVDAFDFF
jgi:hypothetical protein